MAERIEAKNANEANIALKRFNSFHDGYVENVEIKFENYKGLNDKGESTGIGNADKTIILTVNPYPYGKKHDKLVKVEFVDVKSFEMINDYHSGPRQGPSWGIFQALTTDTQEPNKDDIFWDFYFLGDKAKYEVTCSKIIFYTYENSE